jgi:hypothetical protein
MKNIDVIIRSIVKHQEMVIGPLAFVQANQVAGLSVSQTGSVTLTSKNTDTKKLLEQLVKEYEKLFGRASVEVCRDAVKEARADVSKDELPDILQ